MRIVAAPKTSLPASLPGDALLTSVRHLGARFPNAEIRDVTLVRARELDARADSSGATRIWLALESLQVTGSFKVRGALVAIDAIRARAAERGVPIPRVITASAGNHGAGVAYAARALGVKVKVYVPQTAPRAKRDRIEASGAEIVLAPSPNYDDAEALAMEHARAEGAPFLSAYDDLDVVAGNGGSLGFEIAASLGRVPDVAIVPFGGGGLATGIASALAHVGREDVAHPKRRVWGAQSEACPAMARSIAEGHAIVRMVAPNGTLAEGLEGGIAKDAFARARAVVAGVAVVSEDDIARAIAFAARELGVLIEGSSACALAPVLLGLPAEMCGGDVVAVITGRNIDKETLDHALSFA